MDSVTTPIMIKKEEHEADSDLDGIDSEDPDSAHNPVPMLKCCREPSDSPDIFTVPSHPTTAQAQQQQQPQRSPQPPTFLLSTSLSSPPSMNGDGGCRQLTRPTKRARHDQNDNKYAAGSHAGHAITVADRFAPASNDTSTHSPAAKGTLDLNNVILRVHDREGHVSATVALAEFIPHEQAASALVTRFSWHKFLEWHQQSALGRHARQSNRPMVSTRWRTGGGEPGDHGTVVEDKFSWHVFLLEAQEGGTAAGNTTTNTAMTVAARHCGGVRYIELCEC
ncbi:hypothetical protein MN608_11810 [Microdochium nivale]|nr:hypothetical protein MN608_11810 [Microdochium nivale]